MRNIGISVYPSNASLEDNIKYINQAYDLGYRKIFICFLSIFTSNHVDVKEGFEIKLEEAKHIVKHASKMGFEVIADVSNELMKILKVSPEDLSYFAKLGLKGLRLDVGYCGAEESLMTFNNHNLQIELNASINNKYIDAVMSYHPDVHNLIACHNFYPKEGTGLSRSNFTNSSLDFKKHNIRLSAFVNAQTAKFGPWETTEGLCTLEDHRYLSIKTQAKDLFYSSLIDDVIIANAFASNEELKELASTPRNIITLDIDVHTNMSNVEKNIAFNELHVFRGDASENAIRATATRIKYGNDSIPSKNTVDIKRGDVYIENDGYLRYKGEISIALKDKKNNGNSNVIGSVKKEELILLDYIKPWSKFRLSDSNLL